MQVIGTMQDGKTLALLMPGEADAMDKIEQAILAIQQPAPAKPQPAAPARKLAAKPKAHKPTAGGKIKCKQCGEEFERPAGSQRQCCSPECLTTYNREYARRYKREHEKPVAPAVSEEEFKNRRIAMIRAAAEKAL